MSDFISWQQLRAWAFELDNYTCVWCGDSGAIRLHADHLWPLSKGGLNTIENIVTACASCNLSKHAHLIEDRLIPAAICGLCERRSHPQGGSKLSRWGASYFYCQDCLDSSGWRHDLEPPVWEYDELEIEQQAWDKLIEEAGV